MTAIGIGVGALMVSGLVGLLFWWRNISQWWLVGIFYGVYWVLAVIAHRNRSV